LEQTKVANQGLKRQNMAGTDTKIDALLTQYNPDPFTLVSRLRNRIHDAPMPTEHMLDEAADRIEELEAAILMANNRFECAVMSDEVCRDCVKVARSYLTDALAAGEPK
jgi:hypothetical protein